MEELIIVDDLYGCKMFGFFVHPILLLIGYVKKNARSEMTLT